MASTVFGGATSGFEVHYGAFNGSYHCGLLGSTVWVTVCWIYHSVAFEVSHQHRGCLFEDWEL